MASNPIKPPSNFWGDIGASVREGLTRSATDFYNGAMEKFGDRISGRPAKTTLERNFRDAYGETPSGQQGTADYITLKLKRFFASPTNIALTALVVVLVVVFFGRR